MVVDEARPIPVSSVACPPRNANVTAALVAGPPAPWTWLTWACLCKTWIMSNLQSPTKSDGLATRFG